MVTVPSAIAATMPLDAPTVAIEVLPLAHVPPVVALPNVIFAPTHTGVEPVMAEGCALTVTTVDVLQPVDNV
jgi:hypothetical protein